MFHYDKTLFGSPLGIKGNYPLKKKKKKKMLHGERRKRDQEKRETKK